MYDTVALTKICMVFVYFGQESAVVGVPVHDESLLSGLGRHPAAALGAPPTPPTAYYSFGVCEKWSGAERCGCASPPSSPRGAALVAAKDAAKVALWSPEMTRLINTLDYI